MKRYSAIIIALCLAVLSACKKGDSFSITIEMNDSISKSLGQGCDKAVLSHHFDKEKKIATVKYVDELYEFARIKSQPEHQLLDVTIGDFTFTIAPEGNTDIVVRFMDADKYVVIQGPTETRDIGRMHNLYVETKKTVEENASNDSLRTQIIESYKAYVDSTVKREPYSQYAYLHFAERVDVIKEYDFNTDLEDRRLLFRVVQAWKVNAEHSRQSSTLLGMTLPVMEDWTKAVPYSQKAPFVNLSLPDCRGNIRELNELKGKNIVLLFGNARSMGKQELDAMKRFYTNYNDLEIYHVNFDLDEEKFREVAREYPWIMVNDPEYLSIHTYVLEKTPTVYLFNKRGNFVAKDVDFINFKF